MRAALFSFLSMPGSIWLQVTAFLCGYNVQYRYMAPEQPTTTEPTEEDISVFRAGFQAALVTVAILLEQEKPTDPVALVRNLITAQAD